MSKIHSPPVPKYWQFVERFRAQMADGTLKPGDRLPSFVELRTRYGASRATADKVYGILEQEGLIDRQNGNGIFVAGLVSRQRTGILGLNGNCFAGGGQSFYWSGLLEGIYEVAEAAGKELLILGHQSTRGWEKVDGMLVSDWDHQRALNRLPSGLPAVSLVAPHDDVASVYADDYQGIRLSVEHLVALGHRRIAYFHNDPAQPIMTRRLQGYRDAIAAAGIALQPAWTRCIYGTFEYGDQFVSEGRRCMLDWMGDGWFDLGCTAMLCHNDEIAIGVMAALRGAGVEVPRDLSIIGFDGTAVCDMSSPGLTSVRLPLKQIGAQAVEVLLKQIAGGAVSREHRMLPVSLRHGESCAAIVE